MLLKTRFYIPPLRKNIVQREPLLQILNSSEGGQLVVISAPAGYGKTTLISQWLHHSPHTFSWLALDETQAAPGIFWRYFITAINQALPGCGEHSLQLLRDNQNEHALENALIALLNELDAISPSSPRDAMTLVLDDYHLVATPELSGQFNSFLNHLPPSLRIIITSRSAPDLALAKRRASNQLVEIDQYQLRFSAEDSNRFLQQTMSLQIDNNQSQLYFQETEGWIAGLQLIGLSLQKADTTPAPAVENHHTESNGNSQLPTPSLQRNIADYLFDEVFSQQRLDIQNFLLLSAAVPRFTAGLCNALTERNDSLSVINHLDRHNLFLLPLDNHGVWFRYHDLFRRFLLQHFNGLNADFRQQGYNTAALWFEQNGYLQEALEQRLQLRDWDKAETLLLQLLAGDDEINTLLPGWLAHFPQEHSVHQHMPQTPSRTLSQQAFEALLTSREQQVLELVSQGYSNKEIARQLHISLNTLKVHIRNLYGKIGVENRTEVLHKLLSQDDRSP
ncbi:helix-turn-helix transcriptional regulator [Thalassolituus pacificus]|uniref:LuxR C-terminal-related transcriptional regulator n=1 Tax=Thalassolituus pacificus TaxID=2975440 RepID=A0A9X2WFZ8_9GAMM|nr:LuxR C-terminal-related transcriptional regulator [Thalassolituus pacificus]MCT7359722.1 LuxR C-terminal-related transcriptional regulator [Thalassolituus pacificus]